MNTLISFLKKLIMYPLMVLVALIVFVTALFADTYIFRVKLDDSRRKSNVDAFFANRGKKDSRQPFFSTHVLQQSDTNYVLVKVTPSDNAEDLLAKASFGLPDVDLWAQMHVKNGEEPDFVVDNRDKFPVNKNWDVDTSS